MKRHISIGKVFSAVIALSICGITLLHAEPPTGYTFEGYDNAIRKATKSGKKVFLYYGRQGCGFCDMTNKNSFSKDEVKRRYTDHYELVYVDAEGSRRMTMQSGERISEQQFGAKQKVLGTPYFLFLEPDGTPVFKAPGYKTDKDLILFDEYIHGGHYKTKTFDVFSKEHAS